ncbi:hypothetical protein L3Y34_014061 [Caenorhabditis briggsae]|uniref:Uncharacterized protein n=1 Tax=Caenorhabditis briggsae TaxID=6238 RepID=A0AAE9DQK0_CAEBR|nr:hypothetical protein L3Y34_014061 [Caenorhabditis briggsae]
MTPPPPAPPPIIPQIPIITKSTTDETVTPSSSSFAPSAAEMPTVTPFRTPATSLAPPTDEVPRREDDEPMSNEQVTVLCTYGDGWKAKKMVGFELKFI